MLFSIVIPVYNVEDYLTCCIDSVIASGVRECEIILVTGDSSDSSNEICLEYARRYKEIRVVRQNASGLSNARNCGLKTATGEYVVFLDSDDFVECKNFHRALDNVLSLGGAADVYVSDYRWINDKGQIIRTTGQIGAGDTLHIGMDYLSSFLSGYRSFWSVWRYIYRRDFLIGHKIYFKEGYLSEDVDFTTKVLLSTTRLAFCHLPYYCYRIRRSGSLMSGVSYRRIHDAVVIFQNSIERIRADADFAYKELVISRYLFDYLLESPAVYEVPAAEREKTKRLFLGTCRMLDTDFFRAGKLVYLLARCRLFLPFAYTMHLIKCVKKKINVLRGY